ncbi:MAG: hypothetical protein AVDCRST_MAG79-350 [uncultured Thermoleophilia bacterium]|uniref:Carbohydrate kinase PfkB domain-containing protein n=1 Tax=uncultured Thermoleophilia bacterium TaxID=1497501 RepID=A0A6J4THK1_9ACTN|nr:MAG: hypothetical protein AVDCRST_MAG79-350 [uncultured Thermoleophilia bacterium]
MTFDLVVLSPAFLDLTFVGLEGLPTLGAELFAGDLLRSPGGGAITAVAGARLGLRTALAAPLGDDLAGDFLREELAREGVEVIGRRSRVTPVTVVLPVAGDSAMVTVDQGVRCTAADVANHAPAAMVAGIDQLTCVPSGVASYVTCGNDDARAFARRLPAALGESRALFLREHEALVLTERSDLEAAVEDLARSVPTVVVSQGPSGAVAILEGRRHDVPASDVGRPVVDTTGASDLLVAAYVWADLRGADAEERVRWAALYAELSVTAPTAVGGAVSEERLLDEGARHGLSPSPR